MLEDQAPVEDRPLVLRDVPDPQPADDEIRIRVRACGVCRTDVHIAEGDLPLKTSPLILGHEVVGVVDKTGLNVRKFIVGERAGVAWLNWACGTCKFCASKRENLCRSACFTGWSVNGGFAEYATVSEGFAFPLPDDRGFPEMAPWMCPGIAGYRSLRLTEVGAEDAVGLYGFGVTAAYVLQIAKHLGIKTYVVTRSPENRATAVRLGADWVGGYEDALPAKLAAGIIFPPAGNLVSFALGQLERGGKLVLAPVTMTPINLVDYTRLWMEREVKTLAHITRQDGKAFLQLAEEIKLKTKIEIFPFDHLPEALIAVKQGTIKANAIIAMERGEKSV
jgi:propanol-preferring alcohol dehydrogenase